MIVPKMMTRPIRSTVPPNPFIIVWVTSNGFIPVANPTKNDAAINDRNAWTLKREIKRTIMTIAINRMTSNIGPCTKICCPLSFYRVASNAPALFRCPLPILITCRGTQRRLNYTNICIFLPTALLYLVNYPMIKKDEFDSIEPVSQTAYLLVCGSHCNKNNAKL